MVFDTPRAENEANQQPSTTSQALSPPSGYSSSDDGIVGTGAGSDGGLLFSVWFWLLADEGLLCVTCPVSGAGVAVVMIRIRLQDD